ncbi:hypothetical protein J2Y69_003370 [Microbacterium resistens]|uniref:Uncharacterized protein n=1 Tax=Microbacterium resistens TaxID=156977 RepID=A0ABU1SGN2_9MICO|nr:hypothetical protein [Microbacterium resistens]MDR6868746.1 hypothetical protein [Microbacterium resistens]
MSAPRFRPGTVTNSIGETRRAVVDTEHQRAATFHAYAYMVADIAETWSADHDEAKDFEFMPYASVILDDLTPPLPGMVLERIANIDTNEDYSEDWQRDVVTDPADATVITSKIADQDPALLGTPEELHKVILDIDLPAQLIPSTTPGHFHLYIDKEVPWRRLETLLYALADAGVIEKGYEGASVARGHTAARLPWVKKASPTASTDTESDPIL